jgi:HAD superfamily hydrolase (TIGR01509 family)
VKNADLRFKGAIFDQDGLLFDTEVIFEKSWLKAGEELGLPVTTDLTHRLSGCGKKELAAVINEVFPGIDSVALVERAHALAAETQLAMTPELKPGVREMLDFCRTYGIRTVIASSSMHHLVDHNLETTGLKEYFDEIVTGRDVENGKPAPDIFLLAAKRISIPVAECVVFEDAHTGIRAANAAGCCPVLIPDRTAPTAEILKICRTYPTLKEAIDVFTRANVSVSL